MKAEQIDATTWAVTDDDGVTMTVGLRADNSSAEVAIEQLLEARAPLSAEQQAAAGLASERASMVASGFQVRAALLSLGLLAKIEAAVASSGDPFIQLAWERAVEFRRDSPAIAALAPGMGLTDTQMDDLFRLAMSIAA